ncbi:MAG TPA: hypothetical protein PK517_06810, partial [Nitrosomonas sp.]|nr:hypothetical protein [Nitrosomonas sp.]
YLYFSGLLQGQARLCRSLTDALCQKLGLNMTPSEWREWVSPDITYRKVCLKFPEPSDESTFSE